MLRDHSRKKVTVDPHKSILSVPVIEGGFLWIEEASKDR